MPSTLVLFVGFDSSLLSIKTRVLQAAGYTVVSVFSVREAVDRFLAGDFDLILLDQSLPTKDQDRLTCLVRASGLRTPIFSLAPSGGGKVDACAAATLDNNQNEVLLLGLQEILIKVAKIAGPRTAILCDKQELSAASEKRLPLRAETIDIETKRQHPSQRPLRSASAERPRFERPSI